MDRNSITDRSGMGYVARFAELVETINADEETLIELHKLAGHIRNMSRDVRWKAPCDKVRSARTGLVMGQMTAEAFMDLARSALAELPDDAVLEPLDYETGHSRADS